MRQLIYLARGLPETFCNPTCLRGEPATATMRAATFAEH